MKLTYTTIAALLISTASFADNVPQGGVKDSPATVAVTAIGNGTPAQGVVRLTGPDGSQTFHAIDHTTTYRRAQGGTAVVNGGDGFTNAHEAELRNRAALIASLPTLSNGADGRDGVNGVDGADGRDGVDGENGRDGKDGRDGQDFDAAGHAAALAASTALAGLQFQSLSAGQTGWAAGIGGQFDGDAAFAAGLNHGLTDTISMNASIASTFDGNGVSAFIGASGRF